jgi:ribonuclease HI
MGQQANRGKLINWDEIPSVLEKDKFVHVITDGGARPNPGSAGWGAIIRQGGKFTWTFEHCSRATNNAMELRAVIEALRCLPDGMHVWISTDPVMLREECASGFTTGSLTIGGIHKETRLQIARCGRS